MAKVGIISLGCPKNTVDSEELLGEIAEAGHEIESNASCADVLIVNTCGFITSAKEESIEAILEAVQCKTNGICKSVIVTGCLVKRYGVDLASEIPEVDAFVGPGKAGDIAEIIGKISRGEKILDTSDSGAWWKSKRSRILSTGKWTAYLRVADGCDNRCSYCAIPDIRGNFASRSETDVLDEAKSLADVGVKELNLVAQDVTRYGFDTDGRYHLAGLIDKISSIDSIRWIRLLYCYPSRISNELLDVIAGNPKVCKYIDVPLQHCSAHVLDMMRRPGSKSEYLALFDQIRGRCPDISLRTSFIVGFPGETDDDFNELLDFIREVEFDRTGVFRYSREDGTPASLMDNQITKRITDKRFDKIMSVQQKISLANNTRFIGRTLETLIESKTGDLAVGRSYRDAPEIDGLVYIENSDENAVPGNFVNVRIENIRHYDVIGKMI